MITNSVNGKRYIGQTTSKNPLTYWREAYLRRAYNGSERLIHRAIRKYGREFLTFKVIGYAIDKLSLDISEDLFIRLLQTLHPNGYNLKGGGAHGLYSDAVKARMSLSATVAGARPEVKEKHERAMRRPGASERLGIAIREAKAQPSVKEKERATQKKA